MKKRKEMPSDFKNAKRELIKDINSYLRIGASTSVAIDLVVPNVMRKFDIYYNIEHNDKIGEYGCKVTLIKNNDRLTLKF